MVHTLVAAGTRSAAQTGLIAARAGGNAIDAAVAAAMGSWVCEPGMTALGSAAIAIVRPAGEPPVLVDGLTAMPGLGGHAGQPAGGEQITMPYGPGVVTGVGPASVAVPGGLAAIDLLQRRWGELSWGETVEPAIRLASDGFPFPDVSAAYMSLSGEPIYDLTEGSRAVWRRSDGHPRAAGERTRLPMLAADLQTIARDGADVFYTGALAEKIGNWLVAHDGTCGPEDFAAYTVGVREPGRFDDHGWTVSTTDTIGGVALIEMVAGFAGIPTGDGDESARLVEVMVDAVARRDEMLRNVSASTTQICAIDEYGNACSITTSTGYGSGIMVPGTGIMLNNMLGELELLPHGPDVLKPGERLPSNMTPMIATHDHAVVALGAAGADRIAPSIAQTWRGIAARGEHAQVAVESPRFHVRITADGPIIDFEPGFDATGVRMSHNAFDALHMYFGGAQIAMRNEDGTLEGGGDPRRGGVALCSMQE